MKNIMIVLGMISSLYGTQVNCVQIPEGLALVSTLENKNYDKSEVLLTEFKVDVKNYLDNCDNSEGVSEQMHINILTYQDMLADMKVDLKVSKSIDCTNLPKGENLDHAFRSGDFNKIREVYNTYKMDATSYIDQCTSDEKYAFIFEEYMQYDEDYNKWKKL